MSHKKEFFQDPKLDKKQNWKWRLIGSNHEKISEADEGFSSRQAAKKNLDLIKRELSGEDHEHKDLEEHIRMLILGCLVLKMQSTIHYLKDLANDFIIELKAKGTLSCEAGLAIANREIDKMEAERNKRLPLQHDQAALAQRAKDIEERKAAEKEQQDRLKEKEE